MKSKLIIRYLLPALSLFLFIQQMVVLPGCANVVPPSGGPKDTLPPVLLKVTPPDSSRNMKEKTITFQFDEYLDVSGFQQSIFKELLISPLPAKDPATEARLKTVTVRFRDTLEQNTTYSINFGNAVKDNNERNPYKNLTYVFSTGSYFDSLGFSGNVVLAETGKIDTTLLVLLYKTGEDSALINDRPRYVTRLDNKGNFRFHFLPGETYYVYALKDESNSYKYFGGEQLFAFADQPVQVSDSTPTVTLYAYAQKRKEEPAPPLPASTDKNSRENRLKYTTSLNNKVQDLLEEFSFRFQVPLKEFDSAKLLLSTDTLYTPVKDYRWIPDSTSSVLTLMTTWRENTLYNIILEKEFATDTLGQQLLKSDTLHFQTKKLSDYGSVRLNFKNMDLSRNPVIQFIQNDKVVRSFPLETEQLFQPLFLPGNYNLRVLYDDNKNGIWDPGEFFGKHLQPELAVPLPDQLVIKADWENEKDISL